VNDHGSGVNFTPGELATLVPETARHVEVAGAGSRLPASRLNAACLRAKVREAMDCRPGVERMAAGFVGPVELRLRLMHWSSF
jgi:hypothetical protein